MYLLIYVIAVVRVYLLYCECLIYEGVCCINKMFTFERVQVLGTFFGEK